MSLRLFLFNPENDLALASGVENYTPPPAARKIRQDLQLLPIWLAEKGDSVFVNSNTQSGQHYLNELEQRNFLSGVGLWHPGLSVTFDSIYPWGWSPALTKELKTMGINAVVNVKKLRELSHRRTSIHILSWLSQHNPELFNGVLPKECTMWKEVLQQTAHYGDCMLKVPWSGSGRGVVRTNGQNGVEDWCRGVIKRQGSVICEPFLQERLSFAMEFHSDGESVVFQGISIFKNNGQYSFDHAIVASQLQIMEYIEGLKPGWHKLFPRLKLALEQCLAELLAGCYVGYLGVDMMLYCDYGEKELKLMPCVELNLRTTMGIIAVRLARLLDKGRVGRMEVVYHRTPADRAAFLSAKEPLVCNNGLVFAGTLSLVPISSDLRYTATLSVEPESSTISSILGTGVG